MFTVDRSLPTSLPNQIATGMRALFGSGKLAAGDRVPSTRELARQLGVSRGSVVAAYDQLVAEGFLLSAQGAPTVVHPCLPRRAAVAPHSPAPARPSQQRTISLRPSSRHAGTIGTAAWRRAWREAADAPARDIDKSGEPRLRSAIAEHLRLARGLTVDPGTVLVTGGSRDGLLLILMSLGRSLRVGVEDPGHPGLRTIIPLAGHTPVTCRTDARGVVVEALPDDLDALLVTPSHLYPLGGAMPAPRRAELLEWAASRGVVVIEDDFNSELRYRISPQPPLATLSTDATVITLGTFTTLLSKQFSAGYVVAGATAVGALRRTREMLGMPVSPVTQHAIANLLEGGHVRRNARAMHRRLAERKDIVSAQVVPALRRNGATEIEREEVLGVDLLVRFGDGAAQEEFENRLNAGGFECGHVDAESPEGILISFGHLSQREFDAAMGAIRKIPGEG
ncbi:HTH-type transcriptional regulatory protein GabR [Corynebacterium capitovis DSM 44611]|uniref:MocR-like pyridoxine biosynthesis transcription factor PdxR n=1 Tax=Corynebacterium capitovis TaxID=131081 RepID=UPI000376BE03|nr:PLP-dependent aminotransferase family protein [Corynebacterium capitovis]WKD57674.1 HTH-type transcriptional regulatory protein GabR [Corynebacterium capitovis DSM 44611]